MCAKSNGSSFGTRSTWHSSFSDANDWDEPKYYKTIRYPSVNADAAADVCARGADGIYCALSNGASAFNSKANWATHFSDANGWDAAKYYSTIRFPDLDGDGLADVCGRWVNGLWCGISNGTSFTNVHLWSNLFSDANGWDADSHNDSIVYGDIDGDGRADVCGRGNDGVYCAYSHPGGNFEQAHLYANRPSDAAGWLQPQYYKTFMLGNIDSASETAVELCTRAPEGIICE